MKARFLLGPGALALAAAAVTALPASQAAAAPATPAAQAAKTAPLASGSGPGQNVSATAASSWQTNNTVWAIASANGIVYVGGQFTSVRPPGDPSGTGEVARTYLAAFDSSTGALISSFNPTLDGQVTALAVSPDGSTLYAGGSFTHVNGVFHSYLAAFSTATGSLISTWKPVATASVLSISPSPDGTAVYVGGNFGKLDGATRTRAGAVTAATGSVLPWAPNVNGTVTSVAAAPDGSRVLVGGYFTTFNGVTQQAIGSTDPTTGASAPWVLPHDFIPHNSSCTSDVKDIVTSGSTAYIANEGTGGGCFDGDFAVNISDGSLVWQNDCLGATQSVAVLNGWLYKASHAHDCAFSPGGFPQVSNPSGGWVTHHLLTQALTDGSVGHWTPNTDNTNLGPRVLATDGTQLFVGGSFTTVNGKGQQGFARFTPTPDATGPTRPGQPVVTSTSAGVDSVSFSGSSDADDGTITYRIYRDSGTSPIKTITAVSWPWALPVLHFRDSGLTPGSTHTYHVSATDGVKGSTVSLTSAPVTVASSSPALSYYQTVLADNPSFLWPLSETSGTTANDSSPHGFNGVYEPGTTQGATGPITGSGDTATAFDGHTGLVTAASPVSMSATQPFSVEGWFKSSTNTGGKLIGFGNSQSGTSSNYDRHIYMMNDGQLVFGVYNSGVFTIETPLAYNDGQWHYVVATFDPGTGMALYVDGQLIGTNSNKAAQPYTGYWRAGGDNLNGWNLDPWGSNSQGTTEPYGYYFNGTIGDIAVYPFALSAAQVAAHYAANALSH
jgi:Concanavalin A-like lectin/glucanases superfamily